MKFTIPYPPTKREKAAWNKRYGLNAYYAGKHWSHIRRRMVSGPVEITFRWNDGLDIDNHAALGKAFVDAMKGYLLPDDNREWVQRVSHEFWDGDAIQVEVTAYHEK